MNFLVKKTFLTEKTNGLFQNTLFGIMAGAALLFATTSCEKKTENGNFDQGTSAGTLAATCATAQSIPVDANGIITAATLTADTYWKLDGVAYVASGQTLTIQPGTKIMTGATKTYNDPEYGTQTLAGVLVVARGGKLIANGTASQPIVFTTPKALGCTTGCSNAGEFGGIVILGKAKTNTTDSVRIEGVPQPSGVSLYYGGPLGTNDSDNSGSLSYVRIEFPGYKLDTDNEINGLTLGGVGSGTTLSHIQVSYSADDAFEFFGGKVNADHLVAIGTDDDDFDFDFGYTGTIDYAIGLKDPGSTNSGTSGSDSNGIESDNEGSSPYDASPKTKPVLKHFTLLGYKDNATGVGKLKNGNRWRRATSLDMQYSIIAGFPTGVEWGSNAAVSTPANFSNNVVHGYGVDTTTVIASSGTFTKTGLSLNKTATAANTYLLLGPALGGAPFFTCSTASSYNPEHLIPRSTSPAYGTAATYKGAFEPGKPVWTATWTNFNPGFCCN